MERHKTLHHVNKRHNLATFTTLQPARRDLSSREFPATTRQPASPNVIESQDANMASGTIEWRQNSPNSQEQAKSAGPKIPLARSHVLD
jgi:hypothetical protein